jgi:glycosyltransferase involved in cell wall biosynthesis
VHWLGFNSAIHEVYAASDALVLCTVFEPFGRCIIEAMAMGVPCIVPDSGGPPEIVRAGIDGLLFDARSPAALAGSLRALLVDDQMRIELGQSARRRALAFDIEHHVQRVQEVYDELLSRI